MRKSPCDWNGIFSLARAGKGEGEMGIERRGNSLSKKKKNRNMKGLVVERKSGSQVWACERAYWRH